MTSKERIKKAMYLEEPDRVPVMCQLSIGHYFLHSAIKPIDIWFTSHGFADALIALQKRYSFDGILINLLGRPVNYEVQIAKIEQNSNEDIVHWKNGNYTVLPHDDNPHYYQNDGKRYFPAFREIDPDELYYIDPWNLTDITFPFTWDFDKEPRPFNDYFAGYHFDTIRYVKEKVGNSVSVHSEIFSPWSQFLELLNYENALMAIMDDPVKVKACLERLTEGAIDLAQKQAALNVDAILISSAFAGAGLISREHYKEFVYPYEQRIIQAVKELCRIPVYTHTCGSIGDRLDLMIETGTNGIDTLDPPPLGTVELDKAKKILAGKVFIKGNIDPVNTMLYGKTEEIKRIVAEKIKIGKSGGGYILSTACSVAPATSPENIKILANLAEVLGKY